MFTVDGVYLMLVLPVLMAFVKIELTWSILGTIDFCIGKEACGLHFFSRSNVVQSGSYLLAILVVSGQSMERLAAKHAQVLAMLTGLLQLRAARSKV